MAKHLDRKLSLFDFHLHNQSFGSTFLRDFFGVFGRMRERIEEELRARPGRRVRVLFPAIASFVRQVPDWQAFSQVLDHIGADILLLNNRGTFIPLAQYDIREIQLGIQDNIIRRIQQWRAYRNEEEKRNRDNPNFRTTATFKPTWATPADMETIERMRVIFHPQIVSNATLFAYVSSSISFFLSLFFYSLSNMFFLLLTHVIIIIIIIVIIIII